MAEEPRRQHFLIALQGLLLAVENTRLAPRPAAFFDARFARRQGLGIDGPGGSRLRRFHPLYCSPGDSG